MSDIIAGLTIGDMKQQWVAVWIDTKERPEYGQPLWWCEDKGYVVTTKYPHCMNMAGVYFGDELFGLKVAGAQDGSFRGVFVLVRGLTAVPCNAAESLEAIHG